MLVSEGQSRITKSIDKANFDQILVNTMFKGGDNGGILNFKGDIGKGWGYLQDLIRKWRRASQHPKVEPIVDSISDEAVSADNIDRVRIDVKRLEDVEDLDVSETKIEETKDLFEKAFSVVCSKLRYHKLAQQDYKSWYVDGRTYYYVDFDKTDGIKSIRRLDPLLLEYKSSGKNKGKWCYNTNFMQLEIKIDERDKEIEVIPEKNIIAVMSGVRSPEGIFVSYLNKAMRPLDMLNMMENSMAIHRFVRSPERWVFKVDVSRMNRKKAREYMENMRNQYRSRFHIDTVSGTLQSQNFTMAMQENFFLPKTNSQNGGHEIDTIGGGTSYGDIDDVQYWDNKVSEALNSPESFDDGSMFNFSSRLEEITRKEHNWFRFVRSTRIAYNVRFDELLRIQLVETGKMDKDDFDNFIEYVDYVYKSDSVYEESMKKNKLEGKLESVSSYEELLNKYYSPQYITREVLKQTEEETEKYKKEREEWEKSNPNDNEDDE